MELMLKKAQKGPFYLDQNCCYEIHIADTMRNRCTLLKETFIFSLIQKFKYHYYDPKGHARFVNAIVLSAN